MIFPRGICATCRWPETYVDREAHPDDFECGNPVVDADVDPRTSDPGKPCAFWDSAIGRCAEHGEYLKAEGCLLCLAGACLAAEIT